MTAVSTTNQAWRSLPVELLGGVDTDRIADADVNDLLTSLDDTGAGQSFLAWHQYQVAAAVYERLVEPLEGVGATHHIVDNFADAAARIAISQATSQRLAEKMLTEAIALRD
ncbi:hypothetical protein GCM10009624_09430 [Gordonia sinesedis]